MVDTTTVITAIQGVVAGNNPTFAQQSALVRAMQAAHYQIVAQGLTPPRPIGKRLREDRAHVVAASQAASEAGEPGNYVATHDGRVYTPTQMVAMLHRQLITLGLTTSSGNTYVATPNPYPNPAGATGLAFPDISNWQNGMSVSAIKAAGYAGLIAKIGEGASVTQGYGQTTDAYWPVIRQQAKQLFGDQFMGYWYLGDSETPASQAARCMAAIGDPTIPVELDWETGGGNWANCLAVLTAFRQAGLNVTSIYTYQNYGLANGMTNFAQTGCGLRLANYVSGTDTPANLIAKIPTSFWNAYAGTVPYAVQFSSSCTVLPGWPIDCNFYKGSMDSLATIFQGSDTSAPPLITPPVPVGSTPPVFPPAAWKACLDRGLLYAHQSTPWNLDPATLPPPRVVDVAAALLPGGRQGSALAINVPGGCKRNEVVPNIPEFTEGQDFWFGFSFQLSRNFPVGQSFWHVICQWKNDDDGSPPVSLQVHDGQLILTGGYGHPITPVEYDVPLCPVNTRQWYDVMVHIVFSRQPSTGSVDVYVDGQECVQGYHPATGTLYPTSTANTASQSSYLKYGLYRDPTCTVESTVWHMGWAIGSSFGSVMLPAAA